MKIALLSANYGGYADPPPVNYAYAYLVTNGATVPGWQKPWTTPAEHHPRWASRHPKLRPFLWLPERFDACVWVDASVELHDPAGYVEWVVGHLGGGLFAAPPHPDRDCLYEEARAAAQLPKLAYDALTMLAQASWYRRMGHPEHAGLWAMTTLAWRNTPRAQMLGAQVWNEVYEWSDMDQIALPYIMRRENEPVVTLPLNITANEHFVWRNRADI